MFKDLRHSLFPLRTKSPPFPLLELPNELLLLIASYLPCRDLSHLLLTNSRLSSLLTTSLYKHFPIYGTTLKSLPKTITMLRDAVCHGHENVVRALLAQKTFIPTPPSWGESLLNAAIRSGNTTVVALLLDHSQPEPPFPGEAGITPLQIAVLRFDTEMVKFLLSRDFSVHQHSTIPFMNIRCTALHYAVQWGNRDITRQLFAHGADPNSRTADASGMTPFHVALDRGPRSPKKIIKVLIDHGADITLTDKRGKTGMHFAAVNMGHMRRGDGGRESHKAVLEFLVGLGMEIDARDGEGRTPLHCAAEETLVEGYYCGNLVEMGADVGAVTREGKTALHLAVGGCVFVSESLVNTCRVLLEGGVERDAKDGAGRSALDVGKLRGLGRLKRTKDVEILLKMLGEGPEKRSFGRLLKGGRREI